jgi:hypothetical protein
MKSDELEWKMGKEKLNCARMEKLQRLKDPASDGVVINGIIDADPGLLQHDFGPGVLPDPMASAKNFEISHCLSDRKDEHLTSTRVCAQAWRSIIMDEGFLNHPAHKCLLEKMRPILEKVRAVVQSMCARTVLD